MQSFSICTTLSTRSASCIGGTNGHHATMCMKCANYHSQAYGTDRQDTFYTNRTDLKKKSYNKLIIYPIRLRNRITINLKYNSRSSMIYCQCQCQNLIKLCNFAMNNSYFTNNYKQYHTHNDNDKIKPPDRYLFLNLVQNC